jgi:hypothetical protein
MVNPNVDNRALPYVAKARARRAETEREANLAERQVAGVCECGRPADGERCHVCQPAHKAKVKTAFVGL